MGFWDQMATSSQGSDTRDTVRAVGKSLAGNMDHLDAQLKEMANYLHGDFAGDFTVKFSDKILEMQKIISENVIQATDLQKILVGNLETMGGMNDAITRLGNSELIRQLQNLTNGMKNLEGDLFQIDIASSESLGRLKNSLETFNTISENFKKQTNSVLGAMLQNTNNSLGKMEQATNTYLKSQTSNMNTIKSCVIAVTAMVAILLAGMIGVGIWKIKNKIELKSAERKGGYKSV